MQLSVLPTRNRHDLRTWKICARFVSDFFLLSISATRIDNKVLDLYCLVAVWYFIVQPTPVPLLHGSARHLCLVAAGASSYTYGNTGTVGHAKERHDWIEQGVLECQWSACTMHEIRYCVYYAPTGMGIVSLARIVQSQMLIVWVTLEPFSLFQVSGEAHMQPAGEMAFLGQYHRSLRSLSSLRFRGGFAL